MRDEDKAEARKYFSTPLLFSIHEARGWNMKTLCFIALSPTTAPNLLKSPGVNPADLLAEQLDYRRAKTKRQIAGNLQVFVNALYVALTRAIRNVYLIESDTQHPLFELLEVKADGPVKVEVGQASLEDWQKKRANWSCKANKNKPTPSATRFSSKRRRRGRCRISQHTEQLLTKVFRDNAPGSKHRQPLVTNRPSAMTCPCWPIFAGTWQISSGEHVLRNDRCWFAKKLHGVFFAKLQRHSAPMRQTWRGTPAAGESHPLMAATAAGNLPLVDALLERGASLDARTHLAAPPCTGPCKKHFVTPNMPKGRLPRYTNAWPQPGGRQHGRAPGAH